MQNEKKRIFRLDDDSVEVCFYYDDESDKYFGNYPDFDEEPRFTPNGRPWVNATSIECPLSGEVYNDCGSCSYFLKENPKDLIGICTNDANLKKGEPL